MNTRNTFSANVSREELKKLLFVYHLDTGSEPNTEKFEAVRAAMQRTE